MGYYDAILHVCNWSSRKRREIFEEIMLPNLMKDNNPQIQAAQKTTSRKKIVSKHMTVKLPKNENRGNLKAAERERDRGEEREREREREGPLQFNRYLLNILCALGHCVY